MPRRALEVADIFRDHGSAWRDANRGHVSLPQLKVTSAIERCRTAELGGHVARCNNGACGFTSIAYNSCRNRHCPKCQGAQAREWMEDRASELLPVPYLYGASTSQAFCWGRFAFSSCPFLCSIWNPVSPSRPIGAPSPRAQGPSRTAVAPAMPIISLCQADP